MLDKATLILSLRKKTSHQLHPYPTWVNFNKDFPPAQRAPDVGAKILDGAAIIHMLKPRCSRTFQDYAQQIFIPYLLSIYSPYQSKVADTVFHYGW